MTGVKTVMFFNWRRWVLVAAISSVVWLGVGSGPGGKAMAWADCRTHYKASVELLDGATQKAVDNRHPNADIFAADFKKQVGKLQAEKCMPELMNLLQHIEAQKKKYTATPAGKSRHRPLARAASVWC